MPVAVSTPLALSFVNGFTLSGIVFHETNAFQKLILKITAAFISATSGDPER